MEKNCLRNPLHLVKAVFKESHIDKETCVPNVKGKDRSNKGPKRYGKLVKDEGVRELIEVLLSVSMKGYGEEDYEYIMELLKRYYNHPNKWVRYNALGHPRRNWVE